MTEGNAAAGGIGLRTGLGMDVHAFAEGRKLILGGVDVPYERGLAGHSDADVLAHAVADALLGAARAGDIGKLFPDADPAYEGADSLKLLAAVADHVRSLTGKEPSSSINPDECVAQGAAIQGATLAGAQAGLVPRGGGLLLLDVVPMSFAIETVGGIATRMIERNTTLPIHYEQVFTTAAPFQTKVEINVMPVSYTHLRAHET